MSSIILTTKDTKGGIVYGVLCMVDGWLKKKEGRVMQNANCKVQKGKRGFRQDWQDWPRMSADRGQRQVVSY